ncbi:MAG: tetratricopeptide repeat protein, partial [Thermodesulfobacteriota bacterium]
MALDAKAVSIVKDKAENYFNKGKFKDALSTYEQIRLEGKKDPRIFIRVGDIHRKLDETKPAIEAYKEAVEAFAKQGFIIKAIGVCKMIIQMDPSEEAVQKKLAKLYSASNKPSAP